MGMGKIGMRYLTLAGLLLLAGCGNAAQEAYNESIQKGLDIQNKQNELAMDEAAKAKVEEESLLQESIDRNINAYNNLSLPLRMLLATTVVDERAMSPVLLGYTLAYNFDEEYLLLNSHSGAGVGHQWFIIRDDSNTITPIEGLVNMGTSGYRDVAVDSTPVSKADLYNRYMESKESYDLALQNVFKLPEMTMVKYEELRSYNGQ